VLSVLTVERFICLQVKANDASLISSYLSVSNDCKSWHKRWMTVRSDFVLYYFKARKVITNRHLKTNLAYSNESLL